MKKIDAIDFSVANPDGFMVVIPIGAGASNFAAAGRIYRIEIRF
jgi:hypothetical protein